MNFRIDATTVYRMVLNTDSQKMLSSQRSW
jgi:hypothetical protein